MTAALPNLVLEPIVRAALAEDLSPAGDRTTAAVIPEGTVTTARLNARAPATLSGLGVAATAFRLVDPGLRITAHAADGTPCAAGATLMTVEGAAASILMAERVALNFAARLTGIATATARFVAATEGTSARITCTRKTTPGLRAVEKLAVRHGGGLNHRYSLADAILIKDNHIAAAGGVAAVLAAVRAEASHMVAVEIEVDDLDQLEVVLSTGGATAVLLDNMGPETLARAVAMVDGRLATEASGNVTLETVPAIAAAGVDYISAGALTHSVQNVDLGLDIAV